MYPSTPLNGTWHLYNYSGGNYVEAKVLSVALLTFIGITDSVKTVNLTVKNSLGNPVTNILNGKKLKLSQNYGFVQTLGFRYFPVDTTMHTISGSEDFSAGTTNLTSMQIYNYDVGDEFHYHDEYQWMASAHDYYWIIDKVLTKTYSADSDSVVYTMDECSRHEYLNAPAFNVYTFHNTVTKTYALAGSDIVLNKFSWQMFDTTANGWVTTCGNGYLEYYSDTTYLSHLKKEAHQYYSYSAMWQCFEVCLADPPPPDNTYAEGLGWIWESGYNSGGGLVYYKKGTEEWGTPLNCSVLLSTDDIAANEMNVVYPNPFTTSLTVKNADVITLVDYTGKEIIHTKAYRGETMFNTEGLAAGLYFLRVESGGGVRSYKVVKAE